MAKTKKESTVATPSGQVCAWAGCRREGEYKAPRSRDKLKEHVWYCLEHIRLFNASWDYFKDASASDIEAFQREAVIGHRPTKRISGQAMPYMAWIRSRLRELTGEDLPGLDEIDIPKVPAKIRKALRALDLDETASRAEIKKRYKALAKQHHPDAQPKGGGQASLTRFHEVAEAYQALMAYMQT
ncbi:MAG: J domain-containing protein [Alphaproteobacteria bacterium]|nr:J domain-containing protein [Alphaproteobacteria bacterium]